MKLAEVNARIQAYFNGQAEKAMFNISMDDSPQNASSESIVSAARFLAHAAACGILLNQGMLSPLVRLRDSMIELMETYGIHPELKMALRTMSAIADETLTGLKKGFGKTE